MLHACSRERGIAQNMRWPSAADAGRGRHVEEVGPESEQTTTRKIRGDGWTWARARHGIQTFFFFSWRVRSFVSSLAMHAI